MGHRHQGPTNKRYIKNHTVQWIQKSLNPQSNTKEKGRERRSDRLKNLKPSYLISEKKGTK